MEWLMVDATYIKVHPQATGAVGGNQIMGRTKGGDPPQRYTYDVDARGLPLGATVTSGIVADCTEFRNLIEKVEIETRTDNRR